MRPDHALSGMICHQQVSTCYLPNLNSLSPPIMKIRKATEKVENGVVRGQSRSLEIAPLDIAHTSFY